VIKKNSIRRIITALEVSKTGIHFINLSHPKKIGFLPFTKFVGAHFRLFQAVADPGFHIESGENRTS